MFDLKTSHKKSVKRSNPQKTEQSLSNQSEGIFYIPSIVSFDCFNVKSMGSRINNAFNLRFLFEEFDKLIYAKTLSTCDCLLSIDHCTHG